MRAGLTYDFMASHTKGTYTLKEDENARTAKALFKKAMAERGYDVIMGPVERKASSHDTSGGLRKRTAKRWFTYNLTKK